MITITKEDMLNVVENTICPAHYSTIFRELVEVYDPAHGKYTFQQFLAPFKNKWVDQKIPFNRFPRRVRYFHYLVPLFYAAHVLRNERQSEHIIKEVFGHILNDFGHMVITPYALKHSNGLAKNTDYREYWGYTELTSEEEKHKQGYLELYQKCRGTGPAYIIIPQCHGNGGWCGSEIVEVHESIKGALKSRPRWIPVSSPYSGNIINHPRLGLSKDPNKALYIFSRGINDPCNTWKKVNTIE